MLPNFLLIGPGRAGSSWVYRNLRLHPDVFIPKQKSTKYFTENYSKGDDWYKDFFKQSSHVAVGEASVRYLASEAVPERIHKLIPDVKLIAVLRQPVEKAYSMYNRAQALAEDGSLTSTISFEDKFKISPKYVDNGMYARHIKRYYKFFPKENIKILFFDDLKQDNQKFLQQVFLFLGVDETFISPILGKKVGSSEILKSSSSAKPLYYGYRALLKMGFYDTAQYLYNKIKRDKVPLGKELRYSLTKQYFMDDISELEELTSRDLSAWKQ